MSQDDVRREIVEIADRFNILYYNLFGYGERAFNWHTWRGVPVRKCPEDLWRYQEIITRTRPDVIVECGVGAGGSALWFADILELCGHGRVVACDVSIAGVHAEARSHPRIRFIEGSSTSDAVFEQVRGECVDARGVLVSLDSDHKAAHVLEELERYSRLVPSGGYLVVEDTNINGHPVVPQFGPGPHEAVEQFLCQHPEWQRDTAIERSLLTFNPGGYLVRR